MVGAAAVMAPRDHRKKLNLSFLLLSLLCSASILIVFSAFRGSNTPLFPYDFDRETRRDLCNYTDGIWIHDPTVRMRYDNTCKEIFKGWNCISNNKSNGRDIPSWRWQPRACDLPPLDPVRFLERFRDTNIGFVGDSLNRNMFVSLVCTLKRASSEVKKWRPAGADRGFTFLPYNLTVAYHRTNLLARYAGLPIAMVVCWNPLGTNKVFEWMLMFQKAHGWWAPSKFDPIQSPMLFFEKGLPVLPPLPPELGLDMALKHMIMYVERKARPGALKFFRTQSPRHFEGGDWNEGGSCQRTQPLFPEQVEQLFSLLNNGTNMETRLVNQHLYKALQGSSFCILDITHLSEFRADAHPSTAGGKKHDDCMHWCLPGITDSWNDLLVANLNNMYNQI
ncbi:protein trichome birefringence-like 13 isoform X2 [Magnolia sinica]|uniref:protein trichome birefringence-like 13 isoform X2 n=1 Tax=Magnolia sinica TaxID=86752 RepID=UPI0026597C04|nr:protein trichome birefringence-like 13 isoform X2 [Magnolia sinica]